MKALKRSPMASTTGDETQKKDASPPLNPFVHTLDLGLFDRTKIYLLTILLLPYRAVSVFFCILIAYLLSCLGTVGLSKEELTQKPLAGWRRSLSCLITTVWRFLFWVCGLRVRVIGRHVGREKAPILVVAPHSSFLDGFVAYWTGLPSPIVRSEERGRPLLGKLIDFTQPVYVRREDPESRKNTIKEMERRAKATEDDWRQILIFPEGTCTNGTSLVTFKLGAFIPGVPVQPVCIRFPNRLDTLTWTREGPGLVYLLWTTLTQFATYCEIEFLPVYVPSVEEKGDAQLFANNVRDVMAETLKLPITNYSSEDALVIKKAQRLGLPPTIGLIEAGEICREFKLELRVILNYFLSSFARMANRELGTADIVSFAAYLHLPVDHPIVIELFNLYDPDRTGLLDFRNYVRGRCALKKTAKKRDLDLSWTWVKQLLKLDPSQARKLDGFLAFSLLLGGDSDNVLDRLYAVIPEWSWIVSRLTRN